MTDAAAIDLDPDALPQAVRLAEAGAVATLCVHGLTPAGFALATAVRAALEDAGVALRPLAP